MSSRSGRIRGAGRPGDMGVKSRRYPRHGSADELGDSIIRGPIHVRDLHATVLHRLGIDHTRPAVLYQGRRHRLTDVHGTVVKKFLA